MLPEPGTNPYDWRRHRPQVEIARPGVKTVAADLRRGGSGVLAGRGLGKSVLLRQLQAELRRPTRASLTEDGVAELRQKLPPNRLPFAYEIDDPDLPRVVMFRDSFSTSLVPFLVEHYRRIAFYWTNFQQRVVRQEMPELVIEQRA